jgi:hypothetical protein
MCPDLREMAYYSVSAGGSGRFSNQETAMGRLLTMDKQQFVTEMQAEVARTLEQVAKVVNNAFGRWKCRQ